MTSAGGITELKKIASMAHTYGIDVVPHSWGTGIAIHAAMHLIANLDPSSGRMYNPMPLMELDRLANAWRGTLIKPCIQLKEGYLEVPKKPGLGIEVDPEALENYRVNV